MRARVTEQSYYYSWRVYDEKLQVMILLSLITICAQLLVLEHGPGCNVSVPNRSDLYQHPHVAHALPDKLSHVMSDTISVAELFSLVKQLREEQAEILNNEASIYQEQLLRSVTTSLKSATTSLVERQDTFEETTSKRLASLHERISSILTTLQQSPTTAPCLNPPNLFHPTSPGLSASPSTRQYGQFNCNICKENCENLTKLARHISATHPSLRCLHCDSILLSKPDLNLHLHRWHNSRDNTDHPEEALLDNHEPRLTIEPSLVNAVDDLHTEATASSYSCALCKKLFPSHELLNSHLQQDHNILSPAHCVVCENVFLNEAELDRHTTEVHFCCNMCGKRFSSTKDLTDHARSHHPDSAVSDNLSHTVPLPFPHGIQQLQQPLVSYTCKVCAIVLFSFEEFNIHVFTHTMEPSIEAQAHCNICGSAFYNMILLNCHMRDHHDDNIVHESISFLQQSPKYRDDASICETCDYTSESKDNISVHEDFNHSQNISQHEGIV